MARSTGRLVVYGDGQINAAACDARRAVIIDPDQQPRINAANPCGESDFSAPSDLLSNLEVRTAVPARRFDRYDTGSGLIVGYAAESLRTATDKFPLFNVADAHPTSWLHGVLRGQRRESGTQCDPARWKPEP